MRQRMIKWFAASRPEAEVHFHSGPEAAPAVCHDPHCASPRLDVTTTS
jgi:hypothetical protein